MKRNNCKNLKPINVTAKFTIGVASLKTIHLFRKQFCKTLSKVFETKRKL